MAAALLVIGFEGSPHAHAQSRIVAYGDSYVNPGALGIHRGQAPWLALLGEPVRNLGHGGDGVGSTLAIVAQSPVPAPDDDVVLEVGINDVRRHGTDVAELIAFRACYEEVLDLLAPARRVVVVPPLPVRAWGREGSQAALAAHRAVVLQLAADHPNVRVADPLPLWHIDTMIMHDGVHPNAAGRAVLAAVVRRALR